MRRWLPLLTLAVAAGCAGESFADDGRLHVVATTTVTADFARAVGGDEVEVYDIVKPGVDPHDFDPSPADIDALARADVVVTNGIEMEPWLDDALDAAGGDAVVVVAAEGARRARR